MATRPSDFDPTTPAGTANPREGDNQLRLIKQYTQNGFNDMTAPRGTAGVMTHNLFGQNISAGGNLTIAGTTTATGAITATGGVTGATTGAHNGTVGATAPNTVAATNITASGTANITGAITATGGVTGNVTGNTTGAHNGTVGATTPSTVAATTVSASTSVTSPVINKGSNPVSSYVLLAGTTTTVPTIQQFSGADIVYVYV